MQKQMNNSELYQIVGFDAEYVERSASAKGNLFQTARTTTQCVDTLSPGLERIRQAAKRDSKTRFSGLLHHMTPDLLSGAYRSLNPKSVPGVDEMTWQAYGKGLDERLRSLHQRIQSGHYHAMPSKRIWIAKADGRKRPIGIAALEDKIVQKGLVWVLESIYETDFMGFSYGFRPGRSQHRALDALCHFGKAEKSSGSGKNLAAAGGRIRRYATAGTNQTSAGHYSFGRASWYFHGNQSPGDTATAPACFCKAVRYSKGLTLFNSQVWIRLMNISPIWAPLAVL